MNSTQDAELSDFKTAINLSEYAASMGYRKVAQKSSKNSLVMRHPNGDKVVISRGCDQHYTYFSVHQPTDKGSIIDFIQRRTPMSLGQLRRSLRPWMENSCTTIPHIPKRASVTRNRQQVKAAFAATHGVSSNPYLASRGLNSATLGDPRFQGMIREDFRSNTVFPHYDRQGLCGFELKNYHFTGFSKGGVKGLWHSRLRHSDNYLVITESAIDALSYHQLHPNQHTRYFSTAGALSQYQWGLIESAILKLPEGCLVVIAFDNDEQGNAYASELSQRLSVTTKRSVPKQGKDWNEQLIRSI